MFLRTDLPISQQAIQASHAALELGKRHGFSDADHPSLVFIQTPDRDSLASAQDFARSHGLKTYEFNEPYQNWGLTAFACEPISQDRRELFKNFTLWRR